jgi:hypothetical protein
MCRFGGAGHCGLREGIAPWMQRAAGELSELLPWGLRGGDLFGISTGRRDTTVRVSFGGRGSF